MTPAADVLAPSLPVGAADRTADISRRITVLNLRTSLVIGGVETAVADWVRHFDAQRIDARLLCFVNGDGSHATFVQWLADRSQTLTTIPWGRRKNLFAALTALRREVRDAPGPCVIHSHDVRARLLGTLVARLTGVPHVASMHGWHDMPGKVRRLEAADARLLRLADVVLNCSAATRAGSVARGVPEALATTLYNGLDFEPFERPLDREAARRHHGFAPGQFVVGNVARLYPEKGQIHLVEAAALLKPRYPQLRIAIYGDGPERAALEAAIAEHDVADVVALPGFATDFPGTLAALDVFALPSLAEGVPQVIFAAMARGLPIVACPVDGVGEALTDDTSALLVPPGDAVAMTDAIARLIDDPALAVRLGRGARESGRGRFDVRSTTAALTALYERLTAAR